MFITLHSLSGVRVLIIPEEISLIRNLEKNEQYEYDVNSDMGAVIYLRGSSKTFYIEESIDYILSTINKRAITNSLEKELKSS